MKMKKIVCGMVSAALLVSMAAATAFAVESTPSKTGTDADAGKPNYTISGTGDGLEIKVEEKVFAGSTKAVRCVTFALDDVTMVNVQAGTATVAAVIGK